MCLETVDYCHAFDCISSDFMLKAFERFRLDGDFVRWVSVLMRDASYCGWLSDLLCC